MKIKLKMPNNNVKINKKININNKINKIIHNLVIKNRIQIFIMSQNLNLNLNLNNSIKIWINTVIKMVLILQNVIWQFNN
jgi:hypothetical protein